MKILGILLILIGLVDFLGSYSSFDLWGGFFGIGLPSPLWEYSGHIEVISGYILMKIGGKAGEKDSTFK